MMFYDFLKGTYLRLFHEEALLELIGKGIDLDLGVRVSIIHSLGPRVNRIERLCVKKVYMVLESKLTSLIQPFG